MEYISKAHSWQLLTITKKLIGSERYIYSLRDTDIVEGTSYHAQPIQKQCCTAQRHFFCALTQDTYRIHKPQSIYCYLEIHITPSHDYDKFWSIITQVEVKVCNHLHYLIKNIWIISCSIKQGSILSSNVTWPKRSNNRIQKTGERLCEFFRVGRNKWISKRNKSI